MAKKKLLLSLLGLALAQLIPAFECRKPPIYVDLQKRQVGPNAQWHYGSSIGVGSPPQNQSVWPSLRQNDTSVAGLGFCKNSTLQDCEAKMGGEFDPDESSSWISNGLALLNDSGSGNRYIDGVDQLHLYAQYRWAEPVRDTLMDTLPLHVARDGQSNPGYLGIGSSSTIIQRLYDLRLIAARTYSLYIGSGFDKLAGGSNGSNVFGGYDRARFKSPVHTFPMTPDSGDYLRVSVADVIIDHDQDHPAHSRLSVMADEPRFEAVLTSDRYAMLLPAPITRKLMANLHASPTSTNSSDGALHFRGSYNGTISIVLSDGFTVTLPPEILSNSRGVLCFSVPAPDYQGPYYLSTAWLSQVYLMLDFESRVFHLAEAVAEPSHIMSTTFCPGQVPDPNMADMPSGFALKGLVGAIVGAIFGGVAVTSIVIFAFLHFRRRRRAAEAEAAAAAAAEYGKYDKYGQPVTVEKAGGSSGGTTRVDLEMQKITPPAAPLDAKEAVTTLRAMHSGQESIDDISSGANELERPVSPVSDIAVEVIPPRTGVTAATRTTAVKGLAARMQVRAASR